MTWTGVAAVAAALLRDLAGPAGLAVVVLAVGWCLARRLGPPTEGMRRYHLDDDEVTAIGPGRRVRRLPWSAVTTVTQTPHHLLLGAPGLDCALPLSRLYVHEAWFGVLRRVVPNIAADLWARLEDSVVELVPDPDPSWRALAWWAYAPAVVACAVGGGWRALAIAATVAALERLALFLDGRRRTVAVHPAGVMLGASRAASFVAWSHADAMPVVGGLRLDVAGRRAGMMATSAPNFWAAAAVIQLRARLRDEKPAHVHFRLRFANGGLAVVGEVEAAVAES